MADYPEFLHDARVSGLMAKVYMAWRSFDQGDGVWVSNQRVARKLGITERAVQQNTRKLQAIGLIEVKEQFQGERQRTNFYLFPTPQWWVDPGPGVEEFYRGEPPFTLLVDSHGGGIQEREPGSEGGSNSVVGSSEPTTPWSVLPGEDRQLRRTNWTLVSRRSLLYTHQHTWELLDFFTDLVLARDLRETGKVRKISDRREFTWRQSANLLLDQHCLAQVQSVLAWIFTQHRGQLPFPVENEHTGRADPRERRVTRLAQVLDHWDDICAAMQRGTPHTPPVGVEQEVVVQDQVTTLVELFTQTRRHPVTDFELANWSKSFRIMLGPRQLSYDDILAVVTALADRRLELDFSRYHAPYDMYRDDRPGEWDRLRESVRIARLRHEMRPSSPPPPPPPDDDDSFYRMISEEFGT